MKEKIMRQRRVELGMRHRKLANQAKGGVFFFIYLLYYDENSSFIFIDKTTFRL
jgi:hypothetical protein